MSGAINTSQELIHRRPAHPPRARVFRTHPAVTFDNTVSETHTVIEIMASDRPGLLSDVADALNQQGVQISSARIATFGVRAVDVFYVKDIYGVKITHPTKLADVQAQLLDALAAPAVV